MGAAGLAYPLRGRLLGRGVGVIRLGEFSTGTARERVTEWVPGRRLGFAALSQPPFMEEMSPYRRVRSPHVHGYFGTAATGFTLIPLSDERTRLEWRLKTSYESSPRSTGSRSRSSPSASTWRACLATCGRRLSRTEAHRISPRRRQVADRSANPLKAT